MEGVLVPSGHGPGCVPLNARYFSGHVNPEDIDYKRFDFLVFGFSSIREHFHKSIVFLSVETQSEHSNGTGFLLANRRIVTAAHVIRNSRSIRIHGWNHLSSPLISIRVPSNRLDLAVLEFSRDPHRGAAAFQLREPVTVEPIMTLGYPSTPGFHPT